MGYFQVGYASRLVLYEHKMFTRLAIEWAIFVEFFGSIFSFYHDLNLGKLFAQKLFITPEGLLSQLCLSTYTYILQY